jgi:twitching motility protein PilI
MEAGKRSTQVRAKLREFSMQLAERLKAASSTPTEPLRLAVRIGPQQYLLDMNLAAEIVALPEVAPVPWTHPWYRGLANVRGRLIGVVDLMQFMGQAPLAPAEATQLLVFGEALDVNAALLISRAFGLRNLNDLEPLGAAGATAAPWEAMRYRDMDGIQLTELSLERLVASERFATIGA